MSSSLHAQNSTELMDPPRSYPVIRSPETRRYNLKWRNLMARFQGSVMAEATDNLNLSEHDPEADIGFGPAVEAGFLWPITEANLLQVDVGVGYRWYLEHPSVQSLEVAPNSRFDYQIYFDHGRLSLHDNVSVQVDPTSRPDISGNSGGDVTNFRRINNTAGLTADWACAQNLNVLAGYDYILDRSLSGEFNGIDLDTHQFNAAAFYTLSPRISAGLNGSYSLSYYVESQHNDSRTYSVGPLVILKPSQFMTIEMGTSYSVSSFDSRGTIRDDSDFQGLTGQLMVRHTLNSRTTHEFRFSHGTELGLASNFYELSALRYAINLRVHSAVTLSGQVAYEHFRASGSPGERAERYFVNVGAGYQLLRQWRLGASYSFNVKDSNLSGNDYLQHRVTLQLTRQF